MIYKPKGRNYFVVRFRFNGKLIQKRTRATNQKDAKDIAAEIRSELARGNFGILTAKPKPPLAEFLDKDFLPYTKSKFQAVPKSLAYYSDGVRRLKDSELASLRLNEITDQHARAFEAQNSHLKPTTINCGLRTLRRALYLAYDWGKLERKPKIILAKGERQRDRVLTDAEAERNLAVCDKPWKDAATLILGSGMRPSEVFKLRWEHILLNGSGGMIQIAEGKSKAARRVLPMVPAVYAMINARYEAQKRPAEGWVFPTGAVCGHLEQGTAKTQHSRALAALAKAHKEKPEENPEIKPFEPYCLRHTALTNLAAAGCDTFTLARIAGHSSINITQRYCHPQADAIERAFAKMSDGQGACTKAGYQRKLAESEARQSNEVSQAESKR